jgi:electron transfer flavoprotein alpha subunit
MNPGPVAIIAEHNENGLCPVNRDVAACARVLAHAISSPVQGILLGDRPETAAADLAQSFGIDVTAIENPALATYRAEVYAAELDALLAEWNPPFVLTGHTGTGCDFAPGLAVALNAACITAVHAVEKETGRILFHRSVAGGKLTAGVAATTRTTVITVQPGAFPDTPTPMATAGRVDLRRGQIRPERTRHLGIQQSDTAPSNLAEARVVVAAGNGIGEPENLDLLERLATQFHGSAVAGSRPVCDRGWLPYNRQVGITGTVVAPELYIACGISGTTQHVAGMAGSGTVVAINTDARAPIFREADIGIVEDLTTFMPLLLETFEDKGDDGES